MTDIDEVLREAGMRWRAEQQLPDIDVASIARRLSGPGAAVMGPRARLAIGLGFAATAAVALVVVVALSTGGFRRTPASGASATASPSPTLAAAASSIPLSCPVTKPDPPFVPPVSYLREPGVPSRAWYGSVDLWTDLRRDGEDWSGLVGSNSMSQKTFWWSVNWAPHAEPMPAIAVSGRRIDGSGSFSFGPGTNASNPDIGTAMLVGIELPSRGCWRIAASYRGADLSYIVWAGPDPAGSSSSP